LGVWYFERWGAEPAFNRKELGKAAFFGMASLPAIVNAMQSQPLDGEGAQVSPPLDADFIGRSDGMIALQRQITRLSPLDISVLILGESGTGKELIARSLHRNSPRASHPFLAVNCSAIPETLVESELFGYAKGAFTGASMTKQGYIERSHGGTLFLDEIGDLSPAAQAKLLRVMQEKEIQRLGETAPRRIDVRFLFATHKDLKKMIRDGTFREDLFYRISVYALCVSPLRDRPEDVPLLLTHFTEKYSKSFSRGRIQYSPAAMQTLCDYSWPGNVREMENAVQSLLVNVDSGGRIDLKDLPPQIVSGAALRGPAGVTLDEARQEFEREFLKQALRRHSWNKTQTARELGVTRQGLIQMIQRLGLQED
ncbi:MAG TPA: sigma 54-interacting transcriptional regulator, partial [Acidobacteriota bacterium]|nr:sigma 54-interacting transcriptional regulator [Acidobacteriota bacterium]